MLLGEWLGFRIALALHALAGVAYVAWLIQPQELRRRLGRLALAGACLAQLAGLILLSVARGFAAPAGQGESFAAISFGSALLYLYTESRAGAYGMGAFACALTTIFALLAAVEGPAHAIAPVLRDVWFAPHAILILLSFSSFTMSALVSTAYVLQHRQLRSKRPGGLSSRLPALDILDRMTRRATRAGFFWLSFGLLVGMILAQHAWGKAWSWDPKQCMTLLTWMLYGLALFLRRKRDWQGERVATVNLVAFASVLGGMVIVYAFFESAHRFG